MLLLLNHAILSAWRYDDTVISSSSFELPYLDDFEAYYKAVSRTAKTPKHNISDNDLEQILDTIDHNKQYTILEIANIVVNYFQESLTRSVFVCTMADDSATLFFSSLLRPSRPAAPHGRALAMPCHWLMVATRMS